MKLVATQHISLATAKPETVMTRIFQWLDRLAIQPYSALQIFYQF